MQNANPQVATETPAIPFEDLPKTAKELYNLILNYSKQKGYCWAMQESLGVKLNRSERTTRANIKILKEAGYIRIERAEGFTSRRYYPLWQSPIYRPKMAGPPAENGRSTVRKLPVDRPFFEKAPLDSIYGIESRQINSSSAEAAANSPTSKDKIPIQKPPLEKVIEKKDAQIMEPVTQLHPTILAFKALGVDFNELPALIGQYGDFAALVAAWLKGRMANKGKKKIDNPVSFTREIFKEPEKFGFSFAGGVWVPPDPVHQSKTPEQWADHLHAQRAANLKNREESLTPEEQRKRLRKAAEKIGYKTPAAKTKKVGKGAGNFPPPTVGQVPEEAPAAPSPVDEKIEAAAIQARADLAAWEALPEEKRAAIQNNVMKNFRLFAGTPTDIRLLCFAEMKKNSKRT